MKKTHLQCLVVFLLILSMYMGVGEGGRLAGYNSSKLSLGH